MATITEQEQENFVNTMDESYRNMLLTNLASRDYSRKIKDFRLFVILIDPRSSSDERTNSLTQLVGRINRSTSSVFTRNDIAMLNSFLISQPSLYSRGVARLLRQEQLTFRPRQRPRPTSSLLQASISPGVWNRSSPLRYTTSTSEEFPSIPAPTIMDIPPSAPILTTIPLPQIETSETQLSTQGTAPSAPATEGFPTQSPRNILQTPIHTPINLDIITPLQPSIEFEEDKTFYKYIKTDKSSLISESETDNEGEGKCESSNNDYLQQLTDQNQNWIEKNCYSCLNPITQYNYTENEMSDIVSIKQIDRNGKFKRGHCISVNAFRDSLKRDMMEISTGQFNPQTIFSIYKLKNPNLSVDDLKRGLGTKPTKNLVFLLNLPSGSLFIDIESAYKLFHNKDKELYALPLFGGLRRRVGNLKGSLMEISTHHGQIEGYKIYRLLSKHEIESEITVDFELQVLTEMQQLLSYIYKQDNWDQQSIANILNNIIKLLVSE